MSEYSFSTTVFEHRTPSGGLWGNLAEIYRGLSPSVGAIGFTFSITLHGIVGALMYSELAAPSPAIERAPVSVVEFVPVDRISMHPSPRVEHRDVTINRFVDRTVPGTPPIPTKRSVDQSPPRRNSPIDSTATDLLSVVTEEPQRAALAPSALASGLVDSATERGELRARFEAAVFAKLESAKRYPVKALQRKLEGELILNLKLHPDGGVAAVSISRPSGHPLFDQEALQMIARAVPFPAAPQGIEPDALDFVVPIAFRLR